MHSTVKSDRLMSDMQEIGRHIREQGRHATEPFHLRQWITAYTYAAEAISFLGESAALEAAFTGYQQVEAEIAEADRDIAAYNPRLTLPEFCGARRKLEVAIAHGAEQAIAEFVRETGCLVMHVNLSPVSPDGEPISGMTCQTVIRL